MVRLPGRGLAAGFRAVALVVVLLLVVAGWPGVAAGDESKGPIDRALRRRIARDPNSTVAVLVQRANERAGLEEVRSKGGTVRRQLKMGRVLAASLPASAVPALARAPGVLRVSYDPRMRAQSVGDWDDRPLASIYPEVIGARALWTGSRPLLGTGVTVAVLDSGLREHVDYLDANAAGAMGGRTRIVRRVAVATRDGDDPSDDVGHGTYVAGIVAGRGWLDGDGGASGSGSRYAGVAPGADVIGVKVSDRQGVSRLSDVLAGIEWTVDNRERYGIRILNLSLSSTVAESYRTSLLDAAVEFAWFKGLVVVVAAGNGGADSARFPPGNDPYAIVVGATDDAGTKTADDDQLAPFSAFGTTQDGHARPDLVAPGRRVVSTLASRTAALALAYPDRVVRDQYIRLSGTSASAPVVSGAAALLLEARPDLTPDQVKWLLTQTARPVAGAGTGAGYPQVGAAVRYQGAVGRANRDLVPSLHLQRAYATRVGTAFAENGWDTADWAEVGWDAIAWVENGWDSTWWDENGWDENGWDVTGWATASRPGAGD
jgi:serine protease AprX